MKYRFSHKALLTLAVGTAALGLGSCSDFLAEYSQDQVVAKTIQDLNEMLIGDVYIEAQQQESGMRPTQLMSFINGLDDDISTVGTSSKSRDASTAWASSVSPMFGHYAWQQDVRVNYGETSHPEDNYTWNELYRRINHANNVIELVEEMPRNTDTEKTLYHRVKGEAHFLRAQFYFTLANLYSPAYSLDSAQTALCVPLKLTSFVQHDKQKETQFDRATQAEVYQSIVSDLRIAQSELSLSPQPDRYRLHRASAEAAGVLLSRVYLYLQDWSAAEAAARAVLASSKCRLASLTDLTGGKPFLRQDNVEVLFSQGSNYIAPSVKDVSVSASNADFCVTRELYYSYGDGDLRRNAFFSLNGQTDSIALTQKYERGLSLNHISDYFLLRSAEAHLNLAEALVMQKNKDAEALKVVNDFRRQRIEAYVDTTAAGAELARLVREERRREFCFEGHRWFDLRRYAVNKTYPFAKDLVHAYSAYDNNGYFLTTHYYRLPAGDPAYTFALPVVVLSFDKKPMPNNFRPRREEVVLRNPILDDPTLIDAMTP